MIQTAKENSYDIFFSYAWEDIKRATDLVRALRGAGLRVFQDFSRMTDFDDIGTEIRSALDNSFSLVALYSPDFPLSPYCQWELYTALTSACHLDGHTKRVMTLAQDIDYEDIRPRGLTDLRLPPRNAPADHIVHSVVTTVRQLQGHDPRPLGAAPEVREPEWFPYRPAPAACSSCRVSAATGTPRATP